MLRASLLIIVPTVLLLAACSPGPLVPMPAPDPSDSPTGSPSPSAFGAPTDQDWLVQIHNEYLEVSGPVCSWQDDLTSSDPDSEFGHGVAYDRNSAVPDADGNTYYDGTGTILLDFDTGKYTAQRFDGDVTTAIGTGWETFGTFTFERDAHGVITGGNGTGRTTLVHEDGDVEHLTDAMTFTVSLYDDTVWCDLP